MASFRSASSFFSPSFFLLPLAVASFAGCAADTDDAATAGDVGEIRASVEWSACAGEEWARDAQCTSLAVPLRRDRSDGRRIAYRVRRFAPASGSEARAHLWLVPGGPGESGAAFGGAFVEKVRRALPDYAVFVPDHRGTGASARLGYGTANDFSAECFDRLRAEYSEDGMAGFSTTEAANDLAHAIDTTRADGRANYIYSVSYGTYLLNRYLSLHPTQADGVVLDGVCPAEGCADGASIPPDVIGRRYLSLCAKDEVCASKLGADPAATLARLYAKVDEGHCPAVTNVVKTPVLKAVFSGFLDDPSKRELIGPIVYRLDRCSEKDAAALTHLFRVLFTPPPAGAEGDHGASMLLGTSVARGEFFPAAVDLVAMKHERVDTALFADSQTLDVATKAMAWPFAAYDPGPNAHAWAKTNVPVLLLNGTLDAQTPDYRLEGAKAHFRGANQHVVIVPYAPHASMMRSECAFEIATGFFEDPHAAPATACVENHPPIDFGGRGIDAQTLLGTADAWD
jgi:pimeloyl-ACP methyl ester carboxylesterase